MINVRLSREFYSRHGEITNWLFNNVGEGGHWRKDWPDDWLWDFALVFGHADIRFKHDDDATLFSLTWLGQGGYDD